MKALLQNLRTYGAPLLLCVVVAIALIAWWHATHSVSASRALAAFSVAGIVILLAHGAFFPATANESRAADDPTVVRRAIAYDSVVFTITGFAAAVAATPLWQTTLLLGGACLLIGAFFGLLFGYPQGVAQAGGKPGPSGQLDPAAQPSAPQRNLIAESASTLGKVIAGFTLAKVGSFSSFNDCATSLRRRLGRKALREIQCLPALSSSISFLWASSPGSCSPRTS